MFMNVSRWPILLERPRTDHPADIRQRRFMVRRTAEQEIQKSPQQNDQRHGQFAKRRKGAGKFAEGT